MNTDLSAERVIVKRTLHDNGKDSQKVIYASINKAEAKLGELIYSGKFISYGRRPGNLHGKIIELWQELYIGENEPESAPHVA